jgi:predicted DNA-binding transcriptional regulator AlpA
MTASNDVFQIADQGRPPTVAVATRTLVSEAALLIEQRGWPSSAPAVSWNPDHPPLTAGESRPHARPFETWVSAAPRMTTQCQSRPRRAATKTCVSDGPPLIAGQSRSRSEPAKTGISDDTLLTARQSADELNISLPAFWKGVADGRLPAPLYVLPRAPRWRRSDLHAALEGRRMRPAEAKLARWRTNCEST